MVDRYRLTDLVLELVIGGVLVFGVSRTISLKLHNPCPLELLLAYFIDTMPYESCKYFEISLCPHMIRRATCIKPQCHELGIILLDFVPFSSPDYNKSRMFGPSAMPDDILQLLTAKNVTYNAHHWSLTLKVSSMIMLDLFQSFDLLF